MNKSFNMQKRGYYGNCLRHIISSNSYNLYERCMDLFYLSKNISIPRLDYFYKSFYLFRYGINTKSNYYEYITKYIMNFFLYSISWIYFLFWLVTHINLFYKTEKFRLAVDYNGGLRDIKFWDYINPEKHKILVVVRTKYIKNEFEKNINNYKVVDDDEGVFSFYLALKYLIIFAKESFILFFENIDLPPDYYRQISFLTFKKIKYKAFFNKYNCKFFWCRDDYNYEHIIRSQELRQIGGYSMGCNHGVESINSLAFQLLQIDFDYYYMHGLYQYNSTYKKYWSNKMIIKGIGSFMSSPTQHNKIKNTQARNIAIIIAPSFHQEIIFRSILKIAKAFPNITLWISTKPKHRTESGVFSLKYQKLINYKQNVKESLDDVYDLLSDCKYVFSESSTLLAESVYFNKITLCFDPEPKKFKYLYYRKFPELIFTNIESIILRIKETQNINRNFYKDENLNQLICKTKTHPWDIIKDDMLLVENT